VGYDFLFPGVLTANGFKLLGPSFNHFQALISLPRHHGDPFDRIMIAQAKCDGLTIITCDQQFATYGVPLLW
jgi:PIN domain nuclease of toxin-antitoxin system